MLVWVYWFKTTELVNTNCMTPKKFSQLQHLWEGPGYVDHLGRQVFGDGDWYLCDSADFIQGRDERSQSEKSNSMNNFYPRYRTEYKGTKKGKSGRNNHNGGKGGKSRK